MVNIDNHDDEDKHINIASLYSLACSTTMNHIISLKLNYSGTVYIYCMELVGLLKRITTDT